MAEPLNNQQVNSFWQNGFLVLENALTPEQMSALNADFASWVEDSRQHSEAYGEIMDGRPRFHLEPGHSTESPALRRVSSPVEISDVYLEVMRDNRALDAVA